MFLVMLLVFLPVSLDAARSCPEIVHSTANGTYVVELKDRSCPPLFRFRYRYCTVYLHFNEANNEEWMVTKMACTSTCVASNTSGLGVHYMIGCCNSSLCASPSDFFDDINVNITWPHVQRAPIQTSSTIQPTPVISTSIDGRSSSTLSSTTFSPSVYTNKFNYKPCKN